MLEKPEHINRERVKLMALRLATQNMCHFFTTFFCLSQQQPVAQQ